MEIGLGIFGGINIEKQVECFKKYGIKHTFIGSEAADFDDKIKYLNDNDIICDNLHSPFDKINDMWYEGPSGDEMLKRLIDCVDKCAKYNIPAMVVHVSSGRPMTPISDTGDKRYKALMDYANEKNVIIAFENLRYLENLEHNLEKYPESKFCWDCGHEYCYTPGIRFIPMFGKRLTALHIHDNACGIDTDDHLLPFDGNIDFDIIAKDLAESGYEGTLMLEITKEAEFNGDKIYENILPEEYVEKAFASAKKLLDMIEKHKKSL